MGNIIWRSFFFYEKDLLTIPFTVFKASRAKLKVWELFGLKSKCGKFNSVSDKFWIPCPGAKYFLNPRMSNHNQANISENTSVKLCWFICRTEIGNEEQKNLQEGSAAQIGIGKPNCPQFLMPWHVFKRIRSIFSLFCLSIFYL